VGYRATSALSFCRKRRVLTQGQTLQTPLLAPQKRFYPADPHPQLGCYTAAIGTKWRYEVDEASLTPMVRAGPGIDYYIHEVAQLRSQREEARAERHLLVTWSDSMLEDGVEASWSRSLPGEWQLDKAT
jgi:hypothetical protein